ncbi:KH domain-containing protein [Turicibacter sanguinis]|uniref:RNA-binding cell elongation regulator Jag/EloR n=1 Tax=Turicibacter TaxID=191303 RepID=UPI0001FDB5E1|nr:MULTISPECIES: RNA-binding cell elongation regulator Jag/EloR [Turicibacter]EGC91585.1 R3H domain protein [Turicibacter sp. HGF1]MCU7201564.1 KH domain-containing protein [Turicibacter sanguinis]MDB8566822.1 KH domain-containing protein [Turicibacter sanguinis]MDB8569572.1 KH domain-containing protein [Turicibacter sanguinis]MDB8572323.1 KH domain-containing protein [Turicibacter sanguinis]
MKPKIFEGKVMNDILIAAKNHFHQDQQQLIINVLEEKKGIFGLGAYIKAEVSLNLDPIEEGKKYLLQLLNDFNLTGTVEIIPSKQSITFNVNSDNNGLIIGREGKTLQSIQVLTSQVVNQYTSKHLKVLVDIGSYKENQIKKLEALAKKTAKEVLHSKIDAKLDPMNAYDRRIIHNTLSDWKNIQTVSNGVEPNRYLTIKYKA